ncbi:MAG: hypothetical protein V4653_12685, partial [Pseudomonadota bacterium]
MTASHTAALRVSPSDTAGHAADDDHPDVLADLIATLLPGGVPIGREPALALLRRHLGRIHTQVQERFEAKALSGLASAVSGMPVA